MLKHHHLVSNKNLKVVLMSASANVSQLASYFKNDDGKQCKIIQVGCQSPFPIEIKHLDDIEFFALYPAVHEYIATLELIVSHNSFFDRSMHVKKFPIEEVGAFIHYLHCKMKLEGNLDSKILVFLPGRSDILEMSMILDYLLSPNECQLLQLRGSIPMEQQQQIVFGRRQTGGRDIILSTDVVESSVTIPECDIVIDTLLHKRKQATEKQSREKQLMMGLISKDEATQRTGRTGRTRPGKVYRLVSRKTYEKLNQHAKPDMETANVSEVLLILQELLPNVVSGTSGTASSVTQDFSDPRRFLSNISKDEATQRTGRTGRTRPGKVYRLVSRKTYEKLNQHAKPDMETANVSEVLLILQELLPNVVSGTSGTASSVTQDFSDPRRFLSNMVLSPPSSESIQHAYLELEEMGAFTVHALEASNSRRRLSVLGKIMKELYFDPKSVLMVLNGMRYGVLDEAVILAAILQRGSPFYDDGYFEPYERVAQIEIKTICGKRRSDLLACMYAYMSWRLQNILRWKHKMREAMIQTKQKKRRKRKKKKGIRQLPMNNPAMVTVDLSEKDIRQEEQWCFGHFLSISALREIEEVCIQIYDALAETGCFVPSEQFKERVTQLSRRNRKARAQSNFKPYSSKWQKASCLEEYSQLLVRSDLYQHFSSLPDFSSNLSVEDREHTLCWIIAATFPSNTLKATGELGNRTVAFISRRRKNMQKGADIELNSFFVKAGLKVKSIKKSGSRHLVTFCTTKDANVASKLRPANEKYPYKQVGQNVNVTKRRKCYREEVPMVLSQETIADLSGTNTIVCADILPNKGKGSSDAYVCFSMTVLPLDLDLAVCAATYPSFPRCKFFGQEECMCIGELDSMNQSLVQDIRKSMDLEFDPGSNDARSHSKAKIELVSDAEMIVRDRREKVLRVMKALMRESENKRQMEQYSAEEERKHFCNVDIILPSNKVGLVIGKGGSNIKLIQQTSRAKINIGRGTNVATVEGHIECVKTAILLVQEFCQPFPIEVPSGYESKQH